LVFKHVFRLSAWYLKLLAEDTSIDIFEVSILSETIMVPPDTFTDQNDSLLIYTNMKQHYTHSKLMNLCKKINTYIPFVSAFGSDYIVSVGRQRMIRNRKKPNPNACSLFIL
jgi:hypothetical protein